MGEQDFIPAGAADASENSFTPAASFVFEGREQTVSFAETSHVADGVDCEVYAVTEDTTKDLGIIRIDAGKKTPLQRVLQGERTVEGYISGKGKLTVTKPDGEQQVFVADGISASPVVSVNIGETMQWEADSDSSLVAYEVCFPPYEDGRFQNLD